MQPYLWQFFVMTLAGWVNRFQQDAIEYLKEENRVLRNNWVDADYVLPMRSVGGSRRRRGRWAGMA